MKLFNLIQYSFELNKIEIDSDRVEIKDLDWTRLDTEFLNEFSKVDFLIGSDVFFSGKCMDSFYWGFSCVYLFYFG